MAKKYKHNRLPKGLIGTEGFYQKKTGRYIPDLPEVNYEEQKPRITKGILSVKAKIFEKQDKISLSQDKDTGELKIKFYGQPTKQMLDKYGIEVYEYQRDEKAIIGGISTQKMEGQRNSDFERLENDLKTYSADNSLKSYFDSIEDIKPLTLEEILENDLKKFYEEHPDQKRVIDISFSSHREDLIEEKIGLLSRKHSQNFLSKVNTELVHFCRMNLSFSEIKEIVDQFNEIKDISTAPVYFFEKSNASPISEDVSITTPDPDSNPVFVIDSSCNTEHQVIKDAIVESRNISDEDSSHATAVTSLVVCGAGLSPNGDIIQQNKAITVEADLSKLEETILKTVLEYKDKFPLLIVNLSINEYGNQLYNGRKKSNLTILLDELTWQYNCLFIVSAGNLFTSDSWSKEMGDICLKMKYPGYFNLPFTAVLPPADSINNISVGSITYQASPRSIAPQEHPSPITRRNIDNQFFVKPDLVQYDGNLILNSGDRIESEGNGVFFADSESNNQLTRACGTSFSAPLVSHEAGIIHRIYPDFNNNSVKGILIHFSKNVPADQINNDDLKSKLIGFGKPHLETALHSLSHSSTLIIEDQIGMNITKRIKIPIPKGLEGSSRKRMRLRKTLVYNPKVFPQDSENYNPIKISACIIRPDDRVEERELESFSTRDRLSVAHPKSNVKKYFPVEISTNNGYQGKFWEVEVRSECRFEDFRIASDYKQNYSLVLTIEDMYQDETIDIHQEISQMIEVEIPIEINV